MLYARASLGLRLALAATAALSAVGKVLAVLVAVRIADGDVRGAAVLGFAVAVLFAALRIVSNSARVNAECDLQRALVSALLESDVLSAPTSQPLRNLPEPTFYARSLVTDVVPELVASSVAALVVAPIVAGRLPARALLLSAIAVTVVLGALLALGRISAALQARVAEAQEKVFDRAGFAVEGRLEIVARGGEAPTLRALDDAMDRYRRVARRGAWGAALLGRAPLAAGLGAVVIVMLFDASSREAVTSTVLAQAIVLAACLPILLGVVLRANDLVRTSAMVGPVLDVLASPRRAELDRAGAEPPRLPAAVSARGVSFGYGADAPPTLRDVSFEWPTGAALVVEGPNGAGKSTLLRLLLGLRAPQAGAVTVDGAELTGLEFGALRRGIAYLPQRPYLGEAHATVRSALRAVDERISDGAMKSALERVGLGTALSASHGADALDVVVGELSGGQRQRLALARILLQDASIYLLDEPDANLDAAGIELVGEIVRELVARGRMVAIAAHTDELAQLPATRLKL